MIAALATPGREAFDKALQDILDSPGYRHLDNPVKDLLQRVYEGIGRWLVEKLQELFSGLGASAPDTGGLSALVTVLGLVALTALAVMAATMVLQAFDRTPRLKEILGEDITDTTTPRTLREKGSRLAQTGDYRGAIRYEFIAVLLKLHEARMVYLEETWTNEELYGHLERKGFSALEAFGELTHGFNQSWYGQKPYGYAEYGHWARTVERVWEEVPDHAE